MFPLAPLPCIQVHRPSPNARLRHLAQCILPTATTLNSNPHRKTQNMWRRRRRGEKKEGSTLRLHVSKATKEWHKVKIPVCVCQHRDQVFKGKLSVVKVKGLWEAPFCKRNTEKKPFWKSSLFLCSSLPSPLLLRFICLSFLFAPVPLPPFPNGVSGKHCSSSLHPSIRVQKKCDQMMQSPPSPLKWRLEWSSHSAACWCSPLLTV